MISIIRIIFLILITILLGCEVKKLSSEPPSNTTQSDASDKQHSNVNNDKSDLVQITKLIENKINFITKEIPKNDQNYAFIDLRQFVDSNPILNSESGKKEALRLITIIDKKISQLEKNKVNSEEKTIEKKQIQEPTPFVKEHPFYAHIECPGFQLTGCIDNLRVINGGISKNYGINELLLIASSGDGITGVDREFYFAFIHLKRNFTIVAQNNTDHPSLRVRVFSKTASGEMNEVMFDKTTSRKYEVIRVSN
jgi:hypothetical protein